jgi:tetratricopeptide (TPR) repeat protein
MSRSARHNQLRRGAALVCCALAALCVGIAFVASPAPTRAAVPAVSDADKKAANAHFDKAKAFYDQKKYAEAQAENDQALKLDPVNVNAVLLQGLLKNALSGAATAATDSGTGGGPVKIPLLTPAQINVIKVLELGPADTRVVGRIDPKVLEDFWQNIIVKDVTAVSTKAVHDAFVNSANFVGQVRRIRESRDPKYIEQISLTTDPATFVAYRANVQTFVLQNCATAECHSERGQGGNFRLFNPASSSEQQYTNFYILLQYANADGQMIDRANPDKSLIFQYALPWANASAKHPKVDVRKLSGPNDARIRALAVWMNALAFPKPNYLINYAVPGAPPPASHPTTAPTD